MGNKKSATVVVPTIGRASLSKTIRSLKKQTVPVKIVVSYDKKRNGVGWARNEGIRRSNTKYILFLDDDCIAEKNWAKIMVRDLKENQVVGATIVPKVKNKPGWFEIVKGLYAINENSEWITGCSFGARREVFNQIKFNVEKFQGLYCEDDYFFDECRKLGIKLRKSKAKVYHIIPHERLTYKYLIRRIFLQGRSKYRQLGDKALKDAIYSFLLQNLHIRAWLISIRFPPKYVIYSYLFQTLCCLTYILGILREKLFSENCGV